MEAHSGVDAYLCSFLNSATNGSGHLHASAISPGKRPQSEVTVMHRMLGELHLQS